MITEWILFIHGDITKSHSISYVTEYMGIFLRFYDYNADLLSTYIAIMILYIYNTFAKHRYECPEDDLMSISNFNKEESPSFNRLTNRASKEQSDTSVIRASDNEKS